MQVVPLQIEKADRQIPWRALCCPTWRASAAVI